MVAAVYYVIIPRFIHDKLVTIELFIVSERRCFYYKVECNNLRKNCRKKEFVNYHSINYGNLLQIPVNA